MGKYFWHQIPNSHVFHRTHVCDSAAGSVQRPPWRGGWILLEIGNNPLLQSIACWGCCMLYCRHDGCSFLTQAPTSMPTPPHSTTNVQVAVMPDAMYGKFAFNASTAYLRHVPGSSWHGTDSLVVFWLYSHLAWLVRGGLLVVLTVIMISLWVRRVRCACRPLSPRNKDKSCIV